MPELIYSRLGWLPAAPADFTERCKRCSGTDENVGAALRFLASHALNLNQLTRLERTLVRVRCAGAALREFSPFRLGIVANATTDFVAPAIVASGLRFGVLVECVIADYGQVMQSALDPQSRINRAGCDAVLLALDYRAYPLLATPGDSDGAASQLAQAASANGVPN